MNYVFLMDPLNTVVQEKDTSYILMLGAKERGHRVYFLGQGGIVREDNHLYFHVTEVTPQAVDGHPFLIGEKFRLHQHDVDVIFIRTDPPFDLDYLHDTWLLDLLPENIPVINAPGGIRSANEKIWATQFNGIIPPTMVTRNKADCLSFLSKHGDAVVKPTDGHGGKSIFHIQKNERNVNVILETLTNHWKKDAILQAFIPEAAEGDKRILLLNGEPLGAVLRLHAKDDFRNNFYAGGEPLATVITDHDRKIIETIKPKLLENGLYFVGIDILGKYLVEINVTSPTGLQEMNRLNDADLHLDVIRFSEKLHSQFRSKGKHPKA